MLTAAIGRLSQRQSRNSLDHRLRWRLWMGLVNRRKVLEPFEPLRPEPPGTFVVAGPVQPPLTAGLRDVARNSIARSSARRQLCASVVSASRFCSCAAVADRPNAVSSSPNLARKEGQADKPCVFVSVDPARLSRRFRSVGISRPSVGVKPEISITPVSAINTNFGERPT